MFVETEKNVGDQVFFLKKINKVTCDVCDGTGKIHLTKPMDIEQGYDNPDEFVNALVQQFAQNCADVALGNFREYDCPECRGTGMIKAKSPKYEVGHGTVIGIDYSQTVSGTKLIYRVSENGGNPRKLTDDCVWLAEDAAQKKCDFLNLERRMAPIECIQIPHCFAATIPCNEKLIRRLDEWRSKRKFNTEIYVDENMNLFDGYTSYLVYRMLGHMDVPVVIWPEGKRL